MSETKLIKPAARDVVAERLLKARERGILQKATARVQKKATKAREGRERYNDALGEILEACFSFDTVNSYSYNLEESREYDCIARCEAWKQIARSALTALLPGLFFMFLSALHEFFPFTFHAGHVFLSYVVYSLLILVKHLFKSDWAINKNLWFAILFLKNRTYFLQDAAHREKLLNEQNQNTSA